MPKTFFFTNLQHFELCRSLMPKIYFYKFKPPGSLLATDRSKAVVLV